MELQMGTRFSVHTLNSIEVPARNEDTMEVHYPVLDITVSYEAPTSGGGDAPEGAYVDFVEASLPWPEAADGLFLTNEKISALALEYVSTHGDYIADRIRDWGN
jgi:hypothetical protein